MNADAAELALIERARSDPQAFAELYDRHVKRVYGFALRHTADRALAEDITSATFEKALRHLRRYGWNGRSYLAWLYRLAYQQILDHYRRNHRFVSLPADHPSEANVERQAGANLAWQTVARALQQLSLDDQEVLRLRLFEQLSSAETAEVLGCSTTNVYVRLHRALARLQQQLEALSGLAGEKDGATE